MNKLDFNFASSASNATFHALLVGVGDYDHPRFDDLPATVHDVHALAEILANPERGGYPPGNVRTITEHAATGANLRAALGHLAQSTDPQSTVFIYFSGHGARALVEAEGQWQAYLCPREAAPDDLPNTAISGDWFSAALAAIPARRVLVVLDACHAAGSATFKAPEGASIWKAGLPESYYAALSRGSGRVVIASSKEDQFSRVRAGGDLSLFTHHLRKALTGGAAVRGDGLIHVLDVFHYVNQAVVADEPKQTPILKVDDLDLNFPIAIVPVQASQAVRAGGPSEGPENAHEVAAIREQIVRDPIVGAEALSAYLSGRPEHARRRDEVDLKRAELERVQHDLDLFGPNPADKAAKNRAVFHLLRICQDLEND